MKKTEEGRVGLGEGWAAASVCRFWEKSPAREPQRFNHAHTRASPPSTYPYPIAKSSSSAGLEGHAARGPGRARKAAQARAYAPPPAAAFAAR